WLLYASGPMHLLLSVVLYAPGLLVFLYARRTHKHDNVLNRQDRLTLRDPAGVSARPGWPRHRPYPVPAYW
ncbi:hypothetical protein MJN12_23910, partial [Salmonella enterica subsp. enterica serovar Montevideo]|nr:hypothetical protein [Salmonella enterica subsp. enterica serovar Montevideo]